MAAHRCPQPPRAGLRAWRACALRPWRAAPAEQPTQRSEAKGGGSGGGRQRKGRSVVAGPTAAAGALGARSASLVGPGGMAKREGVLATYKMV